MAIAAALIGGTAALAGIEASVLADTPTGPTIVCAAAVLFALSAAFFDRRH
jgi:zinc transport system permease protein